MANEKIEDVIKKVILGEGFLAENTDPTDEPTDAPEGEEEVVEEEIVEEEYEGDLEEAKEEEKDSEEDEDESEEDEEEDEDSEEEEDKKPAFLKKKSMKEAASDYSDTKIAHDANKKGQKIAEPHNANSGKNMGTIKAKSSAASGKIEKPSMKESIETLFAGKELSEEFMSEAATLFEAQLAARTNEIEGELQAKYETLLEEHTLAVTEEMVERIDEYLNYVVEEWMQENRLAVANGLRTEITEGFIERLKGVFAESYIEIPEDKLDLFESTVEDYENLKSELDEQVAKNMETNEECEQLRCELLFREMAEGLTDTETQKLRELAESVEFESVEQFAEKLSVLRENIENIGTVTETATEEESLEESYEEGSEASPLMEAYIKSMSKKQD
jgi:hypothetical protein